MSFKQFINLQFCKVLLIAIIVCTLWMPMSAIASENQSNQDLSQSAMLVAPDPKTKINVYPKPEEGQRLIGYGLSGDPVTVLEQIGSNEGYTWDYVTLDSAPSDTKGWVRGDFVAFKTGNNRGSNQQSSLTTSKSENRYLGKQNSPSGNSRQNNQRQYSYGQQQQYNH
jgi:hypothetical protein